MKPKPAGYNPDTEKLEIIQWVATLNDDAILERLRLIKMHPEADWWNEISQDEKDGINKGLEDLKSGRVKPHEDARKVYEKWL